MELNRKLVGLESVPVTVNSAISYFIALLTEITIRWVYVHVVGFYDEGWMVRHVCC